MKERVEVSAEKINNAFDYLRALLIRRIEQKGPLGYIGPHETLGIVAEEYDELKDAVRSDEKGQVICELADVSVACIFGIASLWQNEEAQIAERREKSR